MRRRLTRPLARAATRLTTWLAPPLYRLYMGFVWRTSRVVEHGVDPLRPVLASRGAVVPMWHEEVFGAPYGFERLGFSGEVLINPSAVGDVATAIAESCGIGVVRGGADRRRDPGRPLGLRRAVHALRERPGTAFAMLVDGSRGPRYRMKPGALLLARQAGCPLLAVRLWYRRCLRLPTWDRTAVPLPWNTIHFYAEGPYELPPEGTARRELEPLRQRIERDLLALAARSFADCGRPLPAALTRRLAVMAEGAPGG